jgi:protein-disulfide isomerase
MTDGVEKASSNFGVPVAIVLAGGLIALAVYYGGGAPAAAPVNPQVAGDPAAEPEPLPTIGDIRPVTEADHVRGPANAKVTIIEYSDLECPFCKRFHPTMQQVMKEYPNDVRWVYRHFPLEALHAQAPAEANAVECAGEQGKAWEMIDKIYAVTPSNDGLILTDLPKYAQEVGVANIATFEACVASNKYAQRVADDALDAEAAGGSGTPYSVAIGPNGEKEAINGAQPYSAVKAVVDKLLQAG